MGDMDSHPSARSGRPGSGRDLHRPQVHQEETDVRAQGGPAQGWWACLAPAAVSPLCCLTLLLGPSRLPRHLSILFAPLWNFLPIKEQVLKLKKIKKIKRCQEFLPWCLWVKNLTVVAQAAEEVRVRSPAHCSGLKDPALPQLQLRFSPWSGNFRMPRMQS